MRLGPVGISGGENTAVDGISEPGNQSSPAPCNYHLSEQTNMMTSYFDGNEP